MDRFEKKAAPSAMGDLRELLFGDVALEDWAGRGEGIPWESFRIAADAVVRGDRDAAAQALFAVTSASGLESRQYVQAWNALRELGIGPSPDEAKHVYGVILDVPVESGLDTLAAYEDGRARYVHYSGRAIIWESPGMDEEIDGRIRVLVDAGQSIAAAIGPWQGARPPVGAGNTRVSVLTPSGLHFGEGPYEALSGDELAAPTFLAATALLVALTENASAG
jgi:hypothetical protein